MKYFFCSMSLFLFINITTLCAQPSGEGLQTSPKVRTVETERALQLMEMNIQDKSSDFVTVNGMQYRWFPNKEKAVEYFNQMNIKRDFTIFYIDSKQPALREPEIITIREKVEIKISE